MSDDATQRPPEIVIVRRRGGEDGGGHHGGAWKIAYADFVTAMMAFFLVMWLINASNEETRAQVASYFNPIKLTDSSTGNRGVRDSKNSKNKQKGEAENSAGGVPPAPSDVKHEAELLANPDKLLAKIEVQIEETRQKEMSSAGAASSGTTAAKIEESAPGVGDPFDPHAWDAVPTAPALEGVKGQKFDRPESEKSAAEVPAEPAVRISPTRSPDDVDPKPPQPVEETLAPPANGQTKSPAPEKLHQNQIVSLHHLRSDVLKQDSAPVGVAAKQMAEVKAISAEISARLGTGLDSLPAKIQVEFTRDGTLISLTDQKSFGMFQSGSAEPQPDLVKLVEAIGSVLENRPGYIVVRGHTDSTPYRNKNYDNWQLSTARAHLAQYMLVRGGLDESRIRRVEGLADRDPKVPEDPQAPENRRIEILLGRD